MVEQVARAIAKADDARFEDDPARFQRLALAALKPTARPTEAAEGSGIGTRNTRQYGGGGFCLFPAGRSLIHVNARSHPVR